MKRWGLDFINPTRRIGEQHLTLGLDRLARVLDAARRHLMNLERTVDGGELRLKTGFIFKCRHEVDSCERFLDQLSGMIRRRGEPIPEQLELPSGDPVGFGGDDGNANFAEPDLKIQLRAIPRRSRVDSHAPASHHWS